MKTKVIENQVQEVLDLLNSKLHGSVDYSLFSEIFDAVASIEIPPDCKIVPVEPSEDMIMAGCMEHGGYDVIDSKLIYKAMIDAIELK